MRSEKEQVIVAAQRTIDWSALALFLLFPKRTNDLRTQAEKGPHASGVEVRKQAGRRIQESRGHRGIAATEACQSNPEVQASLCSAIDGRGDDSASGHEDASEERRDASEAQVESKCSKCKSTSRVQGRDYGAARVVAGGIRSGGGRPSG